MLNVGNQKVIAIGASTGGVDALEKVLMRLPVSIPPIVIAIHMAVGMTKLFSDRLDDLLRVNVKEAQTGDILTQGQVLIAPAGKHMKVVSRMGKLVVECFSGLKINHVIPSIDVLFESIAPLKGKNAVGVILTGIGADGAKGLLTMRTQGATTIGQDEKTSVVYGMPKVAMEIGAVQHQLPINMIADKILLCSSGGL
ncbi:MAG: CheB methylesterase domain-containing protein [Defluviitaleaceae bacterium]|nr:CheB methylesterase domain-containing protein [Defluviitaleaceae bacterium]